jgi:hypothetical protein
VSKPGQPSFAFRFSFCSASFFAEGEQSEMRKAWQTNLPTRSAIKGQLILDKIDWVPVPVVKPGSAAGAGRKKKVVMGDGAEWIWNLADQHSPGTVQIVDLYHARQRLWDLARRGHPAGGIPMMRCNRKPG